MRKMPYTICATCGKPVRLLCAGGDWLNAIYPIQHKNKSGIKCDGWLHEVENKAIIEGYHKKKSP